MDLLVFGTGLYYKNRKKTFEKDNIIAFVDNDSRKKGKLLDGVPIISPDEIIEKKYDYICLMAKEDYVIQMKEQLEGAGIPSEKVINYFQYGMLRKGSEIQLYYWDNYINESSKKVLLMTHELSFTGAPLVLFYVAKILKEKGYLVVVFSTKDGELRREYVENGIMVIVQENNKRVEPILNLCFQQFDCIFACTLTFTIGRSYFVNLRFHLFGGCMKVSKHMSILVVIS